MVADTYVCSGWACTDCLFGVAYDQTPAEMSEADVAAWRAEIAKRNEGYEITLGLIRDEHSCTDDFDGQTAGEAGSECDCETQTFSKSSCDVCGNPDAGQRHGVSFFKARP